MTDILLLSCYELGHQPLSLAWPLAALREAGLAATAVDLSVQSLPGTAVRQASFIAVAVPMHTALRLGVNAARRIRRLNPAAHICFFGLYADLNRDYLGAEGLADSILAGEVEAALVAQAQQVLDGSAVSPVEPAVPVLQRLAFPVPERADLPPLAQYARYTENGTAYLAGYTEASRGCLHTCRHCPVTPVYNGRFFIVPEEVVLADIRQQVAAGAGHITFGDPDFLNGPGHVLNIARALHAEFPAVTFDFTTKVEHLLQKQALLPELRQLGASFVISAFESTSDAVLARLNKGHTVADMETAVGLLRDIGLPVQPTWLPFTPWTTLNDYLHMLGWIRGQRLIPNVPVVQLSIRLLVPPGSALLDHPDAGRWAGPLDRANFTYQWQHPDPRMDKLQRSVTAVAEESDGDAYADFARVEELAYGLAERPSPAPLPVALYTPPPPRLTEDWFC